MHEPHVVYYASGPLSPIRAMAYRVVNISGKVRLSLQHACISSDEEFRLAAITLYYEAYFDIVRNGQYTFKIAEMHKKYGPIIRISPYELHVIDPAFFEKLYRQEGRWDKYAWAYNGFSANGATICTAAHDLHKARRLPLNPFLSKAKVADQQDLIRRNVKKLCDRISKFSRSKKTINLGAASSAFTRDISTEFLLGRNYHSLDHEDFDVGMTNVFQGSGHIWRVTKHIHWFGPTMKSIPVGWIMKVADDGTKAFFRYLQASHCSQNDTEKYTKDLLASAASSSAPDEKAPRTIVHEMLDSGLPPAEKTFARVFDDVATVTGAGFETTASVLRLIIFHVFSNPETLQRLRSELASATAQYSDPVELKTLEQLPYLTSVLMEGMRLSPAIASRMARIAPDRELIYGKWRIPAGTPVGMTTLLMHTDEALYPDPMHFNPDRWMDLDVQTKFKVDKTYALSRKERGCALACNLLFKVNLPATGSQGGVLARQLRDVNWNVNGTVRNLDSPAARALESVGVRLTQGDWDNNEALRAGIAGCDKLFLCLHPYLDDLDRERRQAEKVVKIAKDAGVKQVVASTSLGVFMLDNSKASIAPDSFMAKHISGKKGVEEAVKDGGFEHWTFLRPAFFMANFLEPKVNRYPEVRDKGTWTTSMTAETQIPLLDHVDIAKFATAAFRNPERFHSRAIGMASELLTVQKTLDQLGDMVGRPFKAIFMTEEEIAAQKESNVFVNSQVAMRFMSDYIDMGELNAMVPLTTFKEFLKREEKVVKETYN
ncbi:hypothetical protein G7Y89_g4836 [Cudoniella acicularis]|uniref:NmrA-like domain-containing protein n=1 Tax=Cudoniella acicularis TaxID=354080 RepID=A0A8H4W6A2_9HELO|nr:hypothetical protein G7Y89_g4836 [Cudoniella acicularis]